MPNLQTATLVRQSYGIAMAQTHFGGPRGVWLECTSPGCLSSDAIKGSNTDEWMALPDKDVAAVFRRNGWTGRGDRMTHARCPKCSTLTDRRIGGMR